MTIRAQNVSGASINDTSEIAFTSNSIVLTDYIVDGEAYVDDIRYDLQPSGAYVFKLTLHPDIRRLNETKIQGYTLIVENVDREGEIYRVENIDFRDDFPELMDTGELDLEKIEELINRTQEVLIAEEAAIEDGFISGDLTSTVNKQYVDLNKSNDFSSLARTYLNAGVDPDDSAQFSMPVFAMPSSAMSIGAVENSTPRFAALESSIMTKYQLNMGTRVSLNNTREKLQAEVNRSAPSSYKIEQSIAPINENISSEILLGKKVTASSYSFESTRFFEISKERCDGGDLRFTILPIVKTERDALEDEFIEPQETSVEFDMRPAKASLFEPEVPPDVSVYVNNPYSVSFAIDKKDPAVTSVSLEKSYYDSRLGEIVGTENSEISFNGKETVKIIERSSCYNVEPYRTRIRVAAKVNGAVTLSTSKWIPSHTNDNYDGSHIPDRITIHCANSPEGINVLVDTNEQPARKISVFREDYSIANRAQRTKLVEVIEPNATGEIEETYTFEDTDVVPGRTYRYFTSFQFVHPRESEIDAMMNLEEAPWMEQKVNWSATVFEEKISTNDEIIQVFQSEKSRLYEVEVTRPSVESSGVDSPVRFSPKASLLDDDLNILLQTLKSDGLDIHFLEEIASIKESLPDLAYFSVERINRRKGDRQVIGIVKSGDSITDNFSKAPFEKYTYVFKLLLSPALGTLLLAADPGSAFKDDEKAVSLLTAGFTEMTGIIPSTEKTFEAIDKSLFQTGKEITVNLNPFVPFDSDINLTSSVVAHGYAGGKPSLKLKWSFDFDSDIIDCFYVYCTFKGQKSVIQTIPSVTGVSSNYFYVDTEFYDEVGTKVYSIAPRYSNFTFGPESNRITKTKLASLPPAVLEVMTAYSTPSATQINKIQSLGSLISEFSLTEF